MLKISLPEEEGSHYDAMRAAKLISQIQSVVTYLALHIQRVTAESGTKQKD